MKHLTFPLIAASILAIPNVAWAQTSTCSDALKTDLSALKQEATLRGAAAAQLSCLLDQPHAPLKEALDVTRKYFELSREPSCQILLLDSKLHVRAAQQIEDLEEPSAEQRDALGRHWRAAWEMAAALSYAWAQRSTQDDAAFRSCVLPARQILKNFPAVTITVDPEITDSYEIWWDGFLRNESLPRILPNRHHELTIDPPQGHGVTVWIDQECPKSAPGKLTVYPRTRYHDPYGTHQIHIVFTPLDEYPPASATCHAPTPPGSADTTTPPVQPDGPTPYLPVLFWPGVGVASLGAIGLGVSLVVRGNHEAKGRDLIEAGNCNVSVRECDVNAIYAEYDASNAWGAAAIGSGVALGVGALAIGASFLFNPKPETPKVGAYVHPFFFGTTTSGFAGVRGGF